MLLTTSEKVVLNFRIIQILTIILCPDTVPMK
jgi:hypothetical protein